ncbi:sodium/hydrogen exchanger 8-like [Biomphalaria glabrata]|uniref:Sodium/hydrogen exchanger n=1 Tax=Biomphalaria glabrata TaxID=6526 RepID=A0A9W3AVM7_BIOGL|nr:sodium/hydrogen exchanger 8-like [Biomphalaria glabrata]
MLKICFWLVLNISLVTASLALKHDETNTSKNQQSEFSQQPTNSLKKEFNIVKTETDVHNVLHESEFTRKKQIYSSDSHEPIKRNARSEWSNEHRIENEPAVGLGVTAVVTESGNNSSTLNVTESPTTTQAKPHEEKPDLPEKGAAEEEHHSSLTIFFILLVVAISILVVHLLIQTKFHYLPDSIAIVLIGAFIGLVLKLFQFGNWKKEEAFPPNIFFIVLLPPIIFEGGYNLHKGNFFHNIGSILIFAVFGTIISAVVVGGGVYLLGQAQVAYQLDVVESFAFGSLVSAVDPVATLAIFQALDVDPILYMLVFGESMLNDAVSIVLTTTILEFSSPSTVITSGAAAFFQAVWRFCLMFFASAAIGVAFGLVSAMITKFLNLHKTPSLEVGMVLCFSYLPYALAEGIHLSGIMAILFCGIVMSHYTHLNLSPVSQITVQQTFRSIAFIAETCVFAYLGLAIFSFKVQVKPAFTIWSIVLILVGRALNIFPLSFLVNFFREHKITRKNQFIMWFSGLRGAVAFALSLHMELEEEKHYIVVTTTLIMVLFTIVFLGGSTMPLLKLLQRTDKKYKKRKKKHDADVAISKTKEMGDAIDSEHLSELTEEDEIHVVRPQLRGFLKLDVLYLIPFFTKRFTQQEMKEGRCQVDVLANQWEMEVRAAPSESEDDVTEFETSLISQSGSNKLLAPNGSSTPSNVS